MYARRSREAYEIGYSYLRKLQKEVKVLEQLSEQHFGKKGEFFELLKGSNEDKLAPCYYFTSNEKDFKGGSFEHEALDFSFELCPFRAIQMKNVLKMDKEPPTVLGVFSHWLSASESKCMLLLRY